MVSCPLNALAHIRAPRNPGTITTSAGDGEFRVAISDTGAGMTPEVQSQLFNPAFSTKGARVKAGMGLLVSLNIVQNHGGRIEVDSAVGRGSTFTVIGPCPGAS